MNTPAKTEKFSSGGEKNFAKVDLNWQGWRAAAILTYKDLVFSDSQN